MQCVVCHKRAYSEYCVNHKPRKAIQTKTQPKQTSIKPLTDSVTKRAWLATRTAWLRKNLPNYRGRYICHYCGVEVDYTSVTLDHKIPRSRAPHLRHELTNLVPACWTCNSLKGSVAHDDYTHECHI